MAAIELREDEHATLVPQRRALRMLAREPANDLCHALRVLLSFMPELLVA
jgi:hypothetical protein